jgi:hypothetical protein
MANKKSWAFRISGYAISIIAPMVAVVDQFGYMIGKQDKGIMDVIPCSAVVLFMMLLCFKPVFNRLMQAMKGVTAWKMWLVFAVVGGICTLVGRSLFVIGCFGFAGNLAGHFMIEHADKLSGVKKDGAEHG